MSARGAENPSVRSMGTSRPGHGETKEPAGVGASSSSPSPPKGLDINAVAEWLLQHNYELSALELHQETVENGQAGAKPLLKRFGRVYADRELSNIQQLSAVVVDKAQRRVAGEAELRAAAAAAIDEAEVLRYDLEVAREDLLVARRELEELKAHAADRRATAAPKTEVQLQSIAELGEAAVTRGELRAMRTLVYRFLLEQGLKMTAISFADELPGDPSSWGSEVGEDDEGLPAFAVLYRYFYHAGSNLEVNRLKEALKSQKHAVKECASLRAELQGMKSHSDELETEVTALRGTIQSLRHKLKNASASQLPPPPQAATAHESRAQTSTPLGGALQLDNPNRKYSFAPASPAPNEDEVRISEAIGRLGDLREEEQPAVAIVAESLPHLVKGVIFARRQELIPIFLVVIRSHPDPSVRDMLTRLLFNLIAKPDQVQREMIMAGCSGLASLIGRQKTEVELLPQCWEQIGAKSEERRVLVAESCGRLAPFVRPELRPSLILSILSQLLEDASPVVRQAVSKNFALLISHFGEAEIPKFPAIQETALRLLYDKEQSVSSTTQRALLPLFVDWADACDLLPQRFFDVLCNELKGRLLKRQKAGRLYEDDIHVFQTVVDCLVIATPRFCDSLLLRAPFAQASRKLVREQQARSRAASSKPGSLSSLALSIDDEDDEDGLSSFQRAPRVPVNGTSDVWPSILTEPLLADQLHRDFSAWLASFSPDGPSQPWPYLEWAIKEYVPTLLGTCLKNDLAEEGVTLLRGIADVLYELCSLLGQRYTELFVQPLCFQHLATSGPSTSAGRQQVARVLPVYIAGALPALPHAAGIAFIKDALEKTALQEGGWTREQMGALRLGVQMLAAKFEAFRPLLLELVKDLASHPAVPIRAHVVKLCDILVDGSSEETTLSHILPPLITLANDLDPSVRTAAVAPLGYIALHQPLERILEKVNVQFSNLIEDKAHAVHCEVVKTFERIIPDVVSRFRESCIIPKLLFFAGFNNKQKTPQLRRELAECLFAAYRALNGLVIDAQIVKRYVIPGLNALLNDAPMMESSFKTKLSAMISTMEVAVSEEPVQFPSGVAGTSSSRSTGSGNPTALWNKFVETLEHAGKPKN